MDIALHMDLGEEGRIIWGWWPNSQKIKIYRVISMLLDTHLTSLWFSVPEKAMKAVRIKKGMQAVRIKFMPHWKKNQVLL